MLEQDPRSRWNSRGWLFTVVRRIAARYRRSERRRAEREQRAARRERSDGPVAGLIDEEAKQHAARRVRAELDRLPEPYRSVITRRYIAGRTPIQIAEESHVPLATVKTRLARGLRLLREALDRHDDSRKQAPAPWFLAALIGRSVRRGAVYSAAAILVAMLLVGLRYSTRYRAIEHRERAERELRAHRSIADIVAAAHTAPTVGHSARSMSARVGIQGQVLTSHGPVSGASVEIHVTYADGHAPGRVNWSDRPLARTATGADGRFQLRIEWRRRITVVVVAAEHAPCRSLITLPAVGAPRSIEVWLRPPCRLEGTVATSDGAPVPMAAVTVTQGGVVTAPARLTTHTDTRGRFAMVIGEPDRDALTVWEIRSGKMTVHRKTKTSRLALDFVLPRGACAMRGTVLDPAGSPVPGAVVMATARLRNGDEITITALTNDTGRYRVDGLPRGPIRVAAQPPRRLADLLASRRLTLRVHPLQAAHAVLRLSRAASIHVTTPDHAARVILSARRGTVWVPVRETATTRGGVRIDGLRPQRYRVHAVSGPLASEPVECVAPARVTLDLKPRGRIEGRLSGVAYGGGRGNAPGDQPLIAIDLVANGRMAREFFDARDIFAFDHVPVDEPVFIRVGDERFGPFIVRADATTRLDLTPEPVGTVHGTIADAHGQPVAGALVGLLPAGFDRTQLAKLRRRHWYPRWTVRSNGKGRYRYDCSVKECESLRVGATLVADHPNHPMVILESAVTPTAGSVTRLDLRFPTGETLEGRALVAEGTPCKNGVVTLRSLDPAAPDARTGRTRASGWFRFPGLRPGLYLVSVVGPDGAATEELVASGERGRTLRVLR